MSIDKMTFPTRGFIAQVTEKLTVDCYNYATIFAYSGKGYVHLQKKQGASKIMEVKQALEREWNKNRIKIQHHHYDNGTIWSNIWQDDCWLKGQDLSFASIDALHQNGHATAKMWLLQEMTRTMLFHAKRNWSQENSANLWPYAFASGQWQP